MMFSLIVRSISSSAKPVMIRAWMSTKSTNDSRMMLPWLMLPGAIDTTGNGEKGYKFYSPAENKVIMESSFSDYEDDDIGLVGYSEGWLAMHNKRSHDLFLYDPISARRIELPSIGSTPDKVIIGNRDDMAMMAMMCVKDIPAFCVPGQSALWTDLNLNLNGAPYKDFVYSSTHNLLFCETKFGKKLECWCFTNPRSPMIWLTTCLEEGGYYDDDDDDESNTVIRYLLFPDQSDELFLVKRHMNHQGTITLGFDVFVIDIFFGKLRYVDGCFNGLSLFVGPNNSFALPATELFQQDSIYFTDENHSSDIGIYNYQSGTISYYPRCDDAINNCALPAVWFTPTTTLCTPPSPPPVSNSSKTCTAVSNSSKKRITPGMFLPPLTRDEDCKFYSLADNKIKMVKKWGKEESFIPVECSASLSFRGSSHGWLGLQDSHSKELYLSNPISRHHIKLPSISGYVKKLVISGSPDDEEEEIRAMVTFNKLYPDTHCSPFALAFCVSGRSTEWTPLLGPCVQTKTHGYQDLVYSSRHKLFFCLGFLGRMESWDITDTTSPRIEWSADLKDMGLRHNSRIINSEQGLWTSNYKYLVFDDQSNQLFLIIQHIRRIEPARERVGKKAAGFDVYKIDDWEGGGRGRLIYMDGSLNGLSLFIGNNNSGFALSAADFPELKPDSIYYSTRSNDFGIFNYQDGTFSPKSDFQCDGQPLWFTPASIPSN